MAEYYGQAVIRATNRSRSLVFSYLDPVRAPILNFYYPQALINVKCEVIVAVSPRVARPITCSAFAVYCYL